MSFTPADPAYEKRIRESFARQGAMGLIGLQTPMALVGRAGVRD